MEFNKKNVITFITNNAITVLLIMLVAYVGLTQGGFFSFRNLENIVSNVTPRFLIALGVSGCLITRGTDLSAGRAVGLGGVVACTLLQRSDYSGKFFSELGNMNPFIVLIIVALLCGFFGLVIGMIVSYLKVPPFLATLGVQTVIYGLNLVYSKAEPIGGLKQEYTDIATLPIFTLGEFRFKWLFLFAIVFGFIFYILYNKTRYGKYMYAIGGNESAAEVAGVNVSKMKLKIYALAGIMYGIAGFILAAKSGGASVNLGMGYELEAIAACTIGGVSTNGGVGKVSGILLGVLVFELLKTSMQFIGIDTSLQYVVQGIVIIVAVAIDIRKYISKK